MANSGINILLFFFAIGTSVFAQQESELDKIDSIKSIIETAKHDSVRISAYIAWDNLIYASNPELDEALNAKIQTICRQRIKQKIKKSEQQFYLKAAGRAGNNLGILYNLKDDFKSSMTAYNEGLRAAKLLKDKKLIVKILGNMGIACEGQARYDQAMNYYKKSERIALEINDKEHLAAVYTSIGNIYLYRSAFAKALNYHFKSIKIAEEIKGQYQIAITSCNIGNVYEALKEQKKALTYYFRSYGIATQQGDMILAQKNLNNIGNVYWTLSNDSMALKYYTNCLELSEKINYKRGEALSYGNLGIVNFALKDYPNAEKCYGKSIAIKESIGDLDGLCITLTNMGQLKIVIGDFLAAEKYLLRSIKLSKEIKSPENEKNNHHHLIDLYENKHQPQNALVHYKRYIALRDSIFSVENNKKLLRAEMNHEYDKKAAVLKAEHEKELEKQAAIAKGESQKQQFILWSVGVVLVIMALFVVFIIGSLTVARKQKIMIELKSKETEVQKHIIEEKQKEIFDSILYARRIQRALLPSEKYIVKILNRNRG